MKDYDIKATCIKCGYDIIHTTYSEKVMLIKDVQIAPESLERKCCRCAYIWHERTVDNKEK